MTKDEFAFETALRRAYLLNKPIDIDRMANNFNLGSKPETVNEIAAKVAGWHAERQAIRK